MSKKEDKNELEDGESVADAQAKKSTHETAEKARTKGSRQVTKKDEPEEEEEVTPETRKQAQEELLAAVRRVREEGKKKSTGKKDK